MNRQRQALILQNPCAHTFACVYMLWLNKYAYVCMSVCMHGCMYVNLYVRAYLHMCVCCTWTRAMRAHAQTCTCTQMLQTRRHACAHTHTCTSRRPHVVSCTVCVCMCMCIQIHTHTYIHLYVYLYIYMYMYRYTYTYIFRYMYIHNQQCYSNQHEGHLLECCVIVCYRMRFEIFAVWYAMLNNILHSVVPWPVVLCFVMLRCVLLC